MQAMLTHTKMEMRMFFREIIGLFFVFVMPALCFYFFGSMFGTRQYGDMTYFDRYIPGMIGVILFTAGFFIIGLQVVIDREKGVYKRLKGTPLKPAYVFQAILTKGFFAVFAGALEIILIAKYAFGAPVSGHLLQFLLSLVFSSVTFFAIGFVVASIARRFQSAMAIGFAAMYPMMFLSGATIPLDNLPSGLQAVSNFIPLKYAVELMQNGWMGQLFTASSLWDAVVLGSILVVGVIFSIRFFRWDTE
ncbi:ABC transporter permease [Paenibacillus sp. GCM10012307]|uniref:Transport permease protein n=1 Tax=Paenibacillus roseus TaxID=2798579 RepID=A0A934J3T9_9BACL|nr:ABC transporter permease [Paenibacillus roseus]MBJ6361129.1 ABC transporter permease [Paenibacillus roseus]